MKYLSKYPSSWPPFGNKVSRAFGVTMLSWLGWEFEGDFPNQNKLVVAVAPHTSNWDFLVGLLSMFALGFKASWLGKHTLFTGPLASIFKYCGGVPVNRGDPGGVVSQIQAVFGEQETFILVLAPEGTRKKVGRLKTGFLRMSAAAQVPVLMVGFDYKKKKITIGDLFYPTDDIEADERFCYQYFQQFSAKHPAQY